MTNSVLIRGDGVAARCCGHLLAQAGYRVSVVRAERPRVPVIMLSPAAQSLMRDIFQRDDLFAGLPVIRKRIVAWSSEAVELDHSAVVISEEVLLERLGMESVEAEAGWTICAAPPLPGADAVEHRFGSRMATLIKVEMKETEACWVESVEDGWLFLNSGWLIAVGAPVEELLGKSQLVAETDCWIFDDDGALVRGFASDDCAAWGRWMDRVRERGDELRSAMRRRDSTCGARGNSGIGGDSGGE